MRSTIWLILIIPLLFPFHSDAQTRQPIIFLSGGDIYSYRLGDEEAFRETYWGYNHVPVLSPNGRYIAYGSLPEGLVELSEQGVTTIDYDQYPPTNIWVMEIESRTFTRIAEQAPLNESDPRFIRRTEPVWSPDSQKLAWLQLGTLDGSQRGLHLVIYDLQTGIQTEGPGDLLGVNGDAGMLGLPGDMDWGDRLAYSGFSYGLPDNQAFVGTFMTIFDGNSLYQQRPLSDVRFDENPIQNWAWVEYAGRYYIALQYVAGWQLWDYQTDQYFTLDSPPLLQAVNADSNSLGLTYNLGTIAYGDETWTAHHPNGTVFQLPQFSPFALSPDGQQLVYGNGVIEAENSSPQLFDLYLWDGSQASYLFRIERSSSSFRTGVVWGATEWRVQGSPTPLPEPTPYMTPTVDRG